MTQVTSIQVLLLIIVATLVLVSSFNLNIHSYYSYRTLMANSQSKESHRSEYSSSMRRFVLDERNADSVDNSPKTDEPETYEIKGYLKTDFNEVNDGKQLRVYLYMALALVPCLILIPFFMERDFSPAMDPDAYKF
jgi:hypothetical protein